MVGAGNFFLKRYLEEINLNKNVELTSICRRNKTNLNKISNITGVKNTYVNHKTMFKKENLDIALITSPHSKHYEHLRDAIKSNLNILIEKPIVVTDNQVKKIRILLKNYKKKIISILNPAYDPHFHKVENIVSRKNFGKINYANIYWSDKKKNMYFKKVIKENNIQQNNFRYVNNFKDGSIVYDVLPHLISELVLIIKKFPLSVYAKSNTKNKVTNLNVNLFFKKNVFVSIKLDGDRKKTKRKINSTYYSNKNRISVTGKPYKITNFNLKTKKKINIKFNKKCKNPISEIVDFINLKSIPKIDVKTSLKIVKILNSVEKSLKKDVQVKMKY